jgi:hypothetical protein
MKKDNTEKPETVTHRERRATARRAGLKLAQSILDGDSDNYSVGWNWSRAEEAEFIAAILADKYESASDALPASVTELVEQYLYNLSEATEMYIYNTPEAALVSYRTMCTVAEESGLKGAGFAALLAAVQTLTTKAHLQQFIERARLYEVPLSPPADENDPQIKAWRAQTRDFNAATRVAQMVAHPDTPAETKQALIEAVSNLAQATNVTPTHPTLIEWATDIMLDSVRGKKRQSKAERAAYNRLHKLLKEVDAGDGKPFDQHTRCEKRARQR